MTLRSRCPIHIALEMVGDRWSLLIIRDMLFKHIDGYRGFLDASEKIATNILSDRLNKLTCAGIIEKQASPLDARRVRYVLTEKGLDLSPLILEMILWGDEHGDSAAPKKLIKAIKNNRQHYAEQLKQAYRESL